VEHFLKLAAERVSAVPTQRGNGPGGVRHTIAPDAMRILESYPWPGNVRELRNALERAVALSPGSEITMGDLPPRILEVGRSASMVLGAADRQTSLRELERVYILEVLRQSGGNKTRAAEILGMDRKTLYRKLHEFRLDEEAPEA
jgi:DNA-binding NtrC family response regulator